MNFRSRRIHLLLALLYCLLALGTMTYAKKEDKFPTAAPTTEKKGKDDKKEDVINEPPPEDVTGEAPPEDVTGEAPPEDVTEEAPKTKAPTDEPTKAPTQYPTVPPTASPTDYPTVAPSPEPATPVPTKEGQDPTSSPVEKPTLYAVRMASMVIDITTGGEVDGTNLKEDMEDLLNNDVLDRIYDSFSHVDLEVMLLSTDETRRELDAGYEADIEGAAFFSSSGETPTSEQLSEFLFTYFSIYDSEALTASLSKGNSAITDCKIRTIDGVVVDVQTLNKNTNEGSGGSSVSAGVIVGLVAGVLALVVAIGALVWMKRKKVRGEKGTVASPAARTEVMSSSPQISLEDDVSVGVSSIDDSIYTHNSNALIKNSAKSKKTSAPPQKYDANRLDKVINTAHDFARGDSLTSSENIYDRKDLFEDVYSENSEDGPPPLSNPVSF